MEQPATPEEATTTEDPGTAEAGEDLGTLEAGDWLPGLPPWRDLVPSIIGGALVPLTVYFLARRQVRTDTAALIIAGMFPAAWVIIQFVRRRRVDVIGAIVLVGFATGVTASLLLGGNTYVLKVKDTAFTAIFGIGCLVSVIVAKRPAIFYVGRFLSTGNDPARRALYDKLHDIPIGQRIFKVLSIVWGFGLLIDATARLVLAGVVPTGVFLIVSPVITATVSVAWCCSPCATPTRDRQLGDATATSLRRSRDHARPGYSRREHAWPMKY